VLQTLRNVSGSPPSQSVQDIPASTTTPRSIDLLDSDSAARDDFRFFLTHASGERGLKSAAFCQPSASVEIPATGSDALRMTALAAGKTRRNPGAYRDIVSIGGQNL
jgi:hypothetical protein